MTLTQCKWNARGTVLALAGRQKSVSRDGEERSVAMVQFYTPLGDHVRSLKVPGSNGIAAMSWEGSGLRIALAVDAYIYFANIRPDYMWGSFGATLVYAYNKPDRTDMCVTFWNMNSDERYTKHVKGVRFIAAAGENCLMVVSNADKENEASYDDDEENSNQEPTGPRAEQVSDPPLSLVRVLYERRERRHEWLKTRYSLSKHAAPLFTPTYMFWARGVCVWRAPLFTVLGQRCV